MAPRAFFEARASKRCRTGSEMASQYTPPPPGVVCPWRQIRRPRGAIEMGTLPDPGRIPPSLLIQINIKAVNRTYWRYCGHSIRDALEESQHAF